MMNAFIICSSFRRNFHCKSCCSKAFWLRSDKLPVKYDWFSAYHWKQSSKRNFSKRKIVLLAVSLPNETDVAIIGSGIGGLVTATQLAKKGVRVSVFEKYLIPGGSSGYFTKNGFTFDVGASMIFGLGNKGTTNTLTRALAAVGIELETIPDPVQIHYHLPDNIDIRVHRNYEQFLEELQTHFPHERQGIENFYDECWKVFHCLNSIELLSLEEPYYLFRVFRENPLACLGLAKYLPLNTGDIARKYISDPVVLAFIDLECYCWSVVDANKTPMINAGMVFGDRHYGGIHYPKGGVGSIARNLVKGLESLGGSIHYGAPVVGILCDHSKDSFGRKLTYTKGIQLKNRHIVTSRYVVSNATRWNTFDQLLPDGFLPVMEQRWRESYQMSPSFLSIHVVVDANRLSYPITDCHHIVLESWKEMETAKDAQGTIFLSIPTVLDASLAPVGYHIFHIFTPSWMEEWTGLSPEAYKEKKQTLSNHILARLEKKVFPGLTSAIQQTTVGTPRTHRRFLSRLDGQALKNYIV
ncbi:carotenoid isomerase [Galdieria sulphuraria]|uniref:prolycopene isomerase n=1 Tax=Galdieria sulphuraria TaxID=130081 RepID=M2Y6Y7_GALSU|nr:carotenoid isomerase [Galdieria sulphuraria]EME31614.1 carotenoid isomerase [Galdieria sulphuraria]|eukprot:XP_005708134.1 carotenoid isomerase [Galdieria sulphuraria]